MELTSGFQGNTEEMYRWIGNEGNGNSSQMFY